MAYKSNKHSVLSLDNQDKYRTKSTSQTPKRNTIQYTYRGEDVSAREREDSISSDSSLLKSARFGSQYGLRKSIVAEPIQEPLTPQLKKKKKNKFTSWLRRTLCGQTSH